MLSPLPSSSSLHSMPDGTNGKTLQASARAKLFRWPTGDTAVDEQDDNDDELEGSFFTGNGSGLPCHFLMPLSAWRDFLWNLPTLFSSLPSKVGSFITFPGSSW